MGKSMEFEKELDSKGNYLVKIKYPTELVGLNSRLHIDYPVKCDTLFGELYAMRNALVILKKYNSILADYSFDKPLSEEELKELAKDKNTEYKSNYWKVISLIQLETILADKELVEGILHLRNDNVPYRLQLYTTMVKGKIRLSFLDKKYFTYTKQLKLMFHIIGEVFESLNISNLSPDEYRISCNEVKYRLFTSAVKKNKTNTLFEGIGDLTDKELLDIYMK